MTHPTRRIDDDPIAHIGTISVPDLVFYVVYDLLASQGKCDTPGSGEYIRVREEWYRAGRPGRMAAFILERANCPPGAPIGEDWHQ